MSLVISKSPIWHLKIKRCHLPFQRILFRGPWESWSLWREWGPCPSCCVEQVDPASRQGAGILTAASKRLNKKFNYLLDIDRKPFSGLIFVPMSKIFKLCFFQSLNMSSKEAEERKRARTNTLVKVLLKSIYCSNPLQQNASSWYLDKKLKRICCFIFRYFDKKF